MRKVSIMSAQMLAMTMALAAGASPLLTPPEERPPRLKPQHIRHQGLREKNRRAKRQL